VPRNRAEILEILEIRAGIGLNRETFTGSYQVIHSTRQQESSLPLYVVALVIIAVHADHSLRDRRDRTIMLLTAKSSAVMNAQSLSDAVAQFHVLGANSALAARTASSPSSASRAASSPPSRARPTRRRCELQSRRAPGGKRRTSRSCSSAASR